MTAASYLFMLQYPGQLKVISLRHKPGKKYRNRWPRPMEGVYADVTLAPYTVSAPHVWGKDITLYDVDGRIAVSTRTHGQEGLSQDLKIDVQTTFQDTNVILTGNYQDILTGDQGLAVAKRNHAPLDEQAMMDQLQSKDTLASMLVALNLLAEAAA